MKIVQIASLLLVWCSGVLAENVPSSEIPFELGNDSRIYVQCRVNGSAPLRFLFDTGATDMVVNSAIVGKKLEMKFDGKALNHGATGSIEIPTSSDNSFQIGKQDFTQVPMLGIEHPSAQWEGVIGLWFIRQQVTEVNFTQRKIILYPNGSYTPPKDAIRLKVEYVMDVPVVPVKVTVNGKTYDLRLEVDSGSDRVLDLNTPFVEKHRLLGSQKPFAISEIYSSDRNSGHLENVIFDAIQIGDYKLPRIPGAFSTVKSGVQASPDMDGVMGNNLLKRFNFVCDLQAGYIYLIPNDLLYTPFYQSLIEPAQSR